MNAYTTHALDAAATMAIDYFSRYLGYSSARQEIKSVLRWPAKSVDCADLVIFHYTNNLRRIVADLCICVCVSIFSHSCALVYSEHASHDNNSR